MIEKTGKIFGIGLSKTGTTSLTKALKMLELKTVHFPFFHLKPTKEKLELNYNMIDKWDALTDTPIPYFYKDLDKKYPGSKFILTIRDIDRWLASCEKNHIWPGQYVHDKVAGKFLYFNQVLELHHHLYGSVWFDRENFTRHYYKHIDNVLEYFKDRPDDLIIMNISGGDGWEKLCPFIGQKIPEFAFPRENVGKNKTIKRVTRKYFWQGVSFMHFGHKIKTKYQPKLVESRVSWERKVSEAVF